MDEQMVSTFMEITACESQAYAVQHLDSCRWKLDEAINLYFNSGGDGGAGPSAVPVPIPHEEVMAMKDDGDNGDDGVRAPIPSRVEALYEDDAYYYEDHNAPYIGFGEAPRVQAMYGDDAWYPAPPVPAFHAQAPSHQIEATGWGVAAEPVEIAATGWGDEPEPADGGHVGAEGVDGGGADGGGHVVAKDVDGGESHDDAVQEANKSSSSSSADDSDQDDDDDMMFSDNEVEDYGLVMDEDDSSFFASVQENGTEDAGEQPRPAQPPPPPQQQQDSLDALYQRPLDLMLPGNFHGAKVRAAREDRFLLVNLQTADGAGHFPSMLQNRDLWSDEQVKKAVKQSFLLFLVQKQSSTDSYSMDECPKVCSFYRLGDDQLPAVLVLDPITGQLLNRWSGAMTPAQFMEYVDAYAKEKPSTMSMPKFVKRTPAPAVAAAGELEPASSSAPAAAAAVEQEPAVAENSKPATDEAGEQEPEIPENAAPAGASCSEQEPSVPAPEAEAPVDADMVDDDDEPMESEKMYKLRIRFPDGTMVPKEFGCKRKVASLFAFCSAAVRGGGEAAAEHKAFRIMRFAGRGFEALQGDGGATFEDLGLNFATVSVVFDS